MLKDTNCNFEFIVKQNQMKIMQQRHSFILWYSDLLHLYILINCKLIAQLSVERCKDILDVYQHIMFVDKYNILYYYNYVLLYCQSVSSTYRHPQEACCQMDKNLRRPKMQRHIKHQGVFKDNMLVLTFILKGEKNINGIQKERNVMIRKKTKKIKKYIYICMLLKIISNMKFQ